MDLFYKRSLKPSVLDYSLTRPHSAENVEGTIAENFRAAANQMFSSGSSGSMGNVLYDAYAPILSHVNKTFPKVDFFPMKKIMLELEMNYSIIQLTLCQKVLVH